jgi:hypothetical protein
MINLAKRRGVFLACDNRKSSVNNVKVETAGHFFQTLVSITVGEWQMEDELTTNICHVFVC